MNIAEYKNISLKQIKANLFVVIHDLSIYPDTQYINILGYRVTFDNAMKLFEKSKESKIFLDRMFEKYSKAN